MTIQRDSQWQRGAQLAAVSAFAVAAPLFDLLGRNGEFFVAHGTGRVGILGIALGLCLAPPVLILLLEGAAATLSPRFASALHSLSIAMLVCLAAAPPVVHRLELSTGLAGGLAALIGLLALVLFERLAWFRRFLVWLAWSPVIFASLFLLRSTVTPLFLAAPTRVDADFLRPGSTTPVVMVIFDELAQTSLLDDTGQIDRARYPAFAELADDATWFRATSTVSPSTTESVPAILTGRYPGVYRRLPTLAEHPHNLLSWLSRSHRLSVLETKTRLAEETPEAPRLDEGGIGVLLADLSIVYLHLVLPNEMRRSLPAVDQDWEAFWETKPAVRSAGAAAVEEPQSDDGPRNKAERFRAFIALIGAAGGIGTNKPPLHFIHIPFPHGPWRFLPSGSQYHPYERYGLTHERWSKNAWWATEGWRLHLLQVGMADRLLGELIAKLKETRLYDDSLLIVVADHGLSFWPDTQRRSIPGAAHPEDILGVPLFIKRPGQRERTSSTRIAETIDILPTIADILGAPLPGPVDGCSLFRTDCPKRSERRVYYRIPGKPPRHQILRFPADVLANPPSLARKTALFGAGPGSRGDYAPGPHTYLAGRAVESFALETEPAGRIVLVESVRAILAGTASGFLPVRIVGALELDTPQSIEPVVALAIRGVIESVAAAPPHAEYTAWLSAMLPEAAVEPGMETLRAYLVEIEDGASKLIALRIE